MTDASTPTPTPAPTPTPTPAPTPTPTPAPTPTPTPTDASLLGREQQQQQQQQQQDQPAEWFGKLPDELRADPSLANFSKKSEADLAQAYLETKKLATSKVTLPKDGDPESFARFAAAVRPEEATAYEIEVPDGQSTDFAEAMRPVFHEAGLHPEQVKMLTAANNKFAAELVEQANQKGADELAALKAEMGDTEYERGMQAAVNMLNRLGIKASFEDQMARFIGAGSTVRTLFALAEKTGELGRVHADDVSLALGGLKGDKALAAAQAMIKDEAIRSKLLDQSSPEFKRYNELIKASAQID